MAQTIAGIWKRYSGFVPGAEGIPALTEAQRAVVIGTFASATMNVGHAVRIMDLTSSEKSWQRSVAAEAGVSESRIRQHVRFWALLDAAGLGANVDTDLYLAAQRWYFAGDSDSRNALAAEIGTMGDRDAARVRFFTEATTAHVTKQSAKKQKQGARPEGHKGTKQEQEQEGTRLTKEEQEQATVKVKHPLAQFAAHLEDAVDALKGYKPSEAEQERIVEELAKFTEAVDAIIGADSKVEVAA